MSPTPRHRKAITTLCSLVLPLLIASASHAALVGYWTLDDGSGTTAAATVGNDGTLTGFPTDDSQWVGGVLGGALHFAGDDDLVSFGTDPDYNATTALTIALCVKRETTDTFERFVSNSTSNYQYYAYELGVDFTDRGKWRFRLNSDAGANLKVDMVGGAHEWIHLAATYDSSLPSDNVKIYENGYLIATQDYSAPLTNHGTLKTNRADKTDGMLYGSIDELRIYNTALSQTEVQALVPPLPTPPPSGHWTFDDGSGSTAKATAGNDGTLIGFPIDDSQWVDGPRGGALHFAGDDDLVSFGSDSGYNATRELTIALWVKRETTDTFERFVSNSTAANSYAYELSVDYSEPEKWRFRLNSDDVTLKVDMEGDAGEWIHLAATYDSSLASDNMKIYENGKLLGSLTYSTPLTNHGTLMTNRAGMSTGFLYGSIDDLRIYKRALSQSQIQALIPEPGTALLFATGGLTLMFLALRRRRLW